MKGIIASLRSSLTAKLSIVIVLMIVVTTTAVGSIGYVLYRQDSIAASGERALAVAQTLAAAIDGDAMAASMASGQKDEGWYAAKAAADLTYRENNLLYLYVLGSEVTENVHYYLEGYDAAISTEPANELGAQEEASVYAEETLETLRTGKSSVSEIYPSGDYGRMLTASAPVLDSSGAVRGVVGVDISAEQLMQSVDLFGLQTVIAVVLASVLFGFISVAMIRRSVGRPIEALTRESDRIAAGDTRIELDIRATDEVGRLADSFRRMAASNRQQAETLEALAAGDLTVRAEPRGPGDTMGNAIATLAGQLNQMFAEISESAGQVSLASGSIAQGAQILSEGAVEQGGTIATLAESIHTIASQVEENGRRVDEAVALSHSVIEQAEEGSRQMERMIEAVREIEEANRSIDSVMRIIDEIAMQTNMLALNASIEAAHAGMQGAGFAVVAEEVRNLASRSAESAREIESMIAASIEKTGLGVDIAQETAAAMEKIIQGVRGSNEIVAGIADSSSAQNAAIRSISNSVEGVSDIVQQNTATAQQSAAASEEMSGQAVALQQLLSQFRFDETMGLAAIED